MAFLKFAHFLWETTKPTIILTDKQSVKRFYARKASPPALRNACDLVLQFNFKIAHIAGSVDAAADFISELEMKLTETICFKMQEGIQKTHIEVTMSSSDVVDEVQFFFSQEVKENESEEQILERNNNLGKMQNNGQ